MDSYVYIGVSIYRYVCVGMYICVHIRHAMSILDQAKNKESERTGEKKGKKEEGEEERGRSGEKK